MITKLDISLEHLEALTEFKISGIKIDFHPFQPKLGVACWAEGTTKKVQLKCLVLNLRNMDLEYVQPSFHEQIPLIRKSKNNQVPIT